MVGALAVAGCDREDDATIPGSLESAVSISTNIAGALSGKDARVIDPILDSRIVLDPGHGGRDPGACAYGIEEEDITLLQARKAKQILREHGYRNVVMTRNGDKYVSLDDRVVAGKGADVFLSFHCDSFDGVAYGQTTYICNGEGSEEFGKIVQAKLIEKIGSKFRVLDRGVRKADYRVLTSDTCSALMEIGYIDNSSDNNDLRKNTWFVGKAAYEGIDQFLRSRN